MSTVFISHSSQDDAFVRALRLALADQGQGGWIDSRELRGGDPLWPEIQQAIEAASAYMVVISPDALQSTWVGKELRHALDLRRRRGEEQFPVIPLSLNGTKLGVLEGFFDEEPNYIFVTSDAGGLEAAMRPILDALGRHLPSELATTSRSNERPVRGLTVRRGGRVIWIDRFEDCQVAQHLCTLPGAHRVFEALPDDVFDPERAAGAAGMSRAALQHLADSWTTILKELAASGRSAQLEKIDGPDGFIHTFVAFELLQMVWAQEAEQDGDLCAALLVPDGSLESAAGAAMEVQFVEPAFVLEHGSLRARVVWAGLRVVSRSVVLLPRVVIEAMAGPAASSAIASAVVKQYRERRLLAGAAKLPTLAELKTTLNFPLDTYCGLIVFVHGLLSIDIGTFEPFQKRFEGGGNDQRFLFAGFPHDTFASIDGNGRDLARAVIAFCGTETLPVAFVCHSRGGLVARDAVVKLRATDKQLWTGQIGPTVMVLMLEEGLAEVQSLVALQLQVARRAASNIARPLSRQRDRRKDRG